MKEHEETLSETFIIHHERCKSWFCPDCRKMLVWKVSDYCYSRVGEFKSPVLLTFTTDPKKFSSQSNQYHYVNDKKLIPRILRYIGVKKWIRILEFQHNGNPHWHLLIDISKFPKRWVKRIGKEEMEVYRKIYGSASIVGKYVVLDHKQKGFHAIEHFINYDRVRKIWQKYAGTMVNFTKQEPFKSACHAMNYILKYIRKYPTSNYPKWVMEESNVHIFTHNSRGIDKAKTNPVPEYNETVNGFSEGRTTLVETEETEICAKWARTRNEDNYKNQRTRERNTVKRPNWSRVEGCRCYMNLIPTNGGKRERFFLPAEFLKFVPQKYIKEHRRCKTCDYSFARFIMDLQDTEEFQQFSRMHLDNKLKKVGYELEQIEF